MQFILTTLLVLLAANLAPAADHVKNDKDNTIRVVIITGVAWKGHIWKETAPALKKIVGRTLVWGPATHTVVGDEEAQALLKRPYHQPWLHPAIRS